MNNARRRGLSDEERRDLDETRRLLYMVLVYQRADGRHELAGTLINSLLHHRKVDKTQDEVIDLVLRGLRGEDDALAWLQEQHEAIA